MLCSADISLLYRKSKPGQVVYYNFDTVHCAAFFLTSHIVTVVSIIQYRSLKTIDIMLLIAMSDNVGGELTMSGIHI